MDQKGDDHFYPGNGDQTLVLLAMSKIVFLVYHGQGHFNPCFRLAKILTANNFEVIFAGHPFFKNYVVRQGFQYHTLSTLPFGLGFENWKNSIEKKRNLYWHNLVSRWRNELFHERKNELETFLATTNPEYLLIDSWLNTDILVLHDFIKDRNFKIGIFNAMLSITTEPDLPPLNCLVVPGENIKRALLIFRSRRYLAALANGLRYFGKTNRSLLNRVIRDSKIPTKLISHKPALFGLSYNKIQEFIMMPKEFEFPSDHRSSNQNYLGYMIDGQREESGDEDFESKFNLLSAKIKGGSPLLYCSFGTVAHQRTRLLKSFLQKLISITEHTNYLLITAGNTFDILKTMNLNEQVFSFNRVPQLKVLDHASLFITHGGLNSIKESLLKTVPLLVYPLDRNTDQPGNAARIKYHGLGLTGDLKKDSIEEIEEKISRLLSDSSYMENINRMNEAASRYRDSDFVEKIKSLRAL